MASISLAIVIIWSSLTLAKPEYVLGTPDKGTGSSTAAASAETTGLIENILGAIALYERNIISESLQSMRLTEKLAEIPPVIVPTNDMMYFPSAEHPLFPDYVDKRFSQFEYTVNAQGIVNVDTSAANTDALLEPIEHSLPRLSH